MDESHERTSATQGPPSPPRWEGSQSLEPVYQLNLRCIELLCDVAASASPETTLQVVTANRELWANLHPEARRRLARLPFVIVDVNFSNEEWWRRAAEGIGEAAASNGLPQVASEHLMQETMMFAWQTARWDRTVALVSFGMPAPVADRVASLTPQQIRQIAAREVGAAQIRWSHDLPFWRDLLVAAQIGDEEKLAALHLHAKLVLCGDLVDKTAP